MRYVFDRLLSNRTTDRGLDFRLALQSAEHTAEECRICGVKVSNLPSIAIVISGRPFRC